MNDLLKELLDKINDLDINEFDFTDEEYSEGFFKPLLSFFEKFNNIYHSILDIFSVLDNVVAVINTENIKLESEYHSYRQITNTMIKEINFVCLMIESIEHQLKQNEYLENVPFITDVSKSLQKRKKHLQQMLNVNQQGIVALDNIIKKHLEFISGIDRAKSSTSLTMINVAAEVFEFYLEEIFFRSKSLEIRKEIMKMGISLEALIQLFEEGLNSLDSIDEPKEESLLEINKIISQLLQPFDISQ